MIIVVQQKGASTPISIDSFFLANTLIMAGALTATIVTAPTNGNTIIRHGNTNIGAPIQVWSNGRLKRCVAKSLRRNRTRKLDETMLKENRNTFFKKLYCFE